MISSFVARVGGDAARREKFWRHGCSGTKALCGGLRHDQRAEPSPPLELDEWGCNRDDEHLPQVDFPLAATSEGMPLVNRVLPDSIPDARTVEAALRIARDYGLEKFGRSLDRGLFSAANWRDLIGPQCPLVIGAPWSSTQARLLGFATLALRAEFEKRMHAA